MTTFGPLFHDKLRPVVVMAHPGHEMTILGYMCRVKPTVIYVTAADAAGETHREEVARGILEAVGIDDIRYLHYSEKELFECIRGHNFDHLRGIADSLFQQLSTFQPDLLLTDSFERYNINHDIVNYLCNFVTKRLGDKVEHWEFPLACYAEPALATLDMRDIESLVGSYQKLTLDDAETQKKMDIVGHFARQSRYFRAVVDLISEERWKRESFRPIEVDRDYSVPFDTPWKNYDTHGRERVAMGRYSDPILFETHFVPMVRVLNGLGYGHQFNNCRIQIPDHDS